MENPSEVVALTIAEADAGQRLDRALALAAERAGLPLSRSRLAALIESGAVTEQGRPVRAKSRTRGGETLALALPPPVDAEPQPEDIPLDVVFEDADLIVVNKPAGMVVHPAPGAETGTLVNALLAHCGDTLAGIGGERRPGIVHRIDKETSGLLVAAKTQAAHTALSALFAAHDIERRYQALAWGAPDRADPRLAAVPGVRFESDGWTRIETMLGRHPQDRKKMAVLAEGGRNAVTFLHTQEKFGSAGKPFASLIDCRLETGRTHQIRVHAAHIGHPLIGDPVYARPRRPAVRDSTPEQRALLAQFARQALHAATLGFIHPISGENLLFRADFPADMHELLITLRRNS